MVKIPIICIRFLYKDRISSVADIKTLRRSYIYTTKFVTPVSIIKKRIASLTFRRQRRSTIAHIKAISWFHPFMTSVTSPQNKRALATEAAELKSLRGNTSFLKSCTSRSQLPFTTWVTMLLCKLQRLRPALKVQQTTDTQEWYIVITIYSTDDINISSRSIIIT